MNYMEQVAKMLGVEMEEEFHIKGNDYKYKITKYGMENFCDFSAKWDFANNILVGILTGHYEIKKPILDDVEKEYLSAVIKPWREKVISIIKIWVNEDYFISIRLKNGEKVNLPWFKKDTMYKGMEVNKEYTLEELGL